MAKTSSTGSTKRSAAKSGGSARKPAGKSSAKGSNLSSSSKTQSRAKSGGSSQTSAADALVKLLESPLVAEILAIGASAALATLASQRFGRREEGQGTRRALKTAAKAAAAAMGQRLATEVEEIRAASKAKGSAAA